MFNKKINEFIVEVSHKKIDQPKKSVYFNHIHNHCEILLFLSGEANYNIDGHVLRPEAYDLLFIPAATYHYLIPTSETVPYENYVIGIDPALINPEHYERLFSEPLMLSIAGEPFITDFFKRLDDYNELYSSDDFKKAASSLIDELIIYLYYKKDSLKSRENSVHSHISAIISFVAENIQKPLDASVIAAHFHFSKSYVQNLFSKVMHIGLKKYIMQKKIYAANTDLSSGLSPSAVAAKYSFGDYSSFYRLYKKTFLGTPVKH